HMTGPSDVPKDVPTDVISPTPLPPDQDNTPTEGEHFPRTRRAGWSRWQIFGPIGAALLAVMVAYALSLRAPRTIAGLRAAGEAVGGVPYGRLDAALDRVSDRFLDSRIVLAFGHDQRVVKRREVGYVVDRASAKELIVRAGKSGNPFADVALRSRARRGKVDL